jgi:hypothetical protein
MLWIIVLGFTSVRIYPLIPSLKAKVLFLPPFIPRVVKDPSLSSLRHLWSSCMWQTCCSLESNHIAENDYLILGFIHPYIHCFGIFQLYLSPLSFGLCSFISSPQIWDANLQIFSSFLLREIIPLRKSNKPWNHSLRSLFYIIIQSILSLFCFHLPF